MCEVRVSGWDKLSRRVVGWGLSPRRHVPKYDTRNFQTEGDIHRWYLWHVYLGCSSSKRWCPTVRLAEPGTSAQLATVPDFYQKPRPHWFAPNSGWTNFFRFLRLLCLSLIPSPQRAYFPPLLAEDKGEITGFGGNQSLLQTFRHSRKRNLKYHNYRIEFHCIMVGERISTYLPSASLIAKPKLQNGKSLSDKLQGLVECFSPHSPGGPFRAAMTARKSLASMLCINRRYHADVGNNAVCWNKTLSVGTQLCF